MASTSDSPSGPRRRKFSIRASASTTAKPSLLGATPLVKTIVVAGLVAGAGALFLHARMYSFLCDDAFISFRYAHNFAHGHGLVFNPGHERVEGYSNFLWVA